VPTLADAGEEQLAAGANVGLRLLNLCQLRALGDGKIWNVYHAFLIALR
jgi:hypothetical protein